MEIVAKRGLGVMSDTDVRNSSICKCNLSIIFRLLDYFDYSHLYFGLAKVK